MHLWEQLYFYYQLQLRQLMCLGNILIGFTFDNLGAMMRMPGLPAIPASENMTIDNDGVISGLS